MKILVAVVTIIVGLYFIYSNYNDGKDKEIDFTDRSYIVHLGGYLAGIIFILVGILMLLDLMGVMFQS